MLDDIDHTDWAALGHAHGTAEDVPAQIRGLTSADERVRELALWNLYGAIVHHGTRYEASAHAVPFLLELLTAPTTPDRVAIAELLTFLALGCPESWLPHGVPIAEYRAWDEGGAALVRGAEDTPDGDDIDRLRTRWELAAYDAVRAGLPLLRHLVFDADPALRVAAAYALAWFPENAAESLPVLVAAAADPDAALAATALVGVGLLGGFAQTPLLEPALEDGRAEVRWAAAVALARLDGPATAWRAVEELLHWSAGGGRRHGKIPYRDGDLGGYAAQALGQVGDRHRAASFDTLLSWLPAVSGV